jgi:hypothetical protein
MSASGSLAYRLPKTPAQYQGIQEDSRILKIHTQIREKTKENKVLKNDRRAVSIGDLMME